MKFFLLLSIMSTALALPTIQSRAQNTTCTPQQTALLVDGIERNMNYQMDELKSLKTLQYLGATATTTLRAANSTTDPLYTMQQSSVATLQKKAIDVRTENQKLAGEMNSPPTLQMGLAMVAREQNSAKVQLRQLKAGNNDTMILEEMVKGAEMAMKQNEENLKLAKEGKCRA